MQPLKSVYFLLLGLILVVDACQMPQSGLARLVGGLKLSFLIAGAGQGASRSAAEARLILPTVSTIQASLTAVKGGRVLSQTVSIKGGSTLVSLDFGPVDLGDYTAKAQAIDSSGTVQFQQTATFSVTATAKSITLNLVPVVSSPANSLTSGQLVAGTLAAGAALSWVVPATALDTGGWSLSLSADPSILLYAQDTDGALFPASDTSGSVTTVKVKSAADSFLTLYNSGTKDQTYVFGLNTSVKTGSVVFTIPATPTPTIAFVPSSITYSYPATQTVTLTPSGSFTASATSWQWYLDGILDPSVRGATYSFDPSLYSGAHVISVSVVDQGLLLSGSFTFAVYQPQ